MRILLSSFAVLGVGGYAVVGVDAAPDFDKTIGRTPAEVYDAFSSVSPEGSATHPGEGGMPSITVRVEKESGKSVTYEVLFGDKEAVTATVEFEPAGNGESTRVTAELDVDQDEIARLAGAAGGPGTRLPRIPEALFDIVFRRQMEELTDRVARGEPLAGIEQTGAAAWQGINGRPDSSPSQAAYRDRYEREARQRAAVQPMTNARPMVDPNESARRYLNGH